MTAIEELIHNLEGDYEALMKRLRNEALISSFLEDFLEDETYQKLEAAMEAHDDEAAFQEAHTLKGVTLNMEFGFLTKSSMALTEALRGGRKPEADELFLRVKEDYAKTVNLIRKTLNK